MTNSPDFDALVAKIRTEAEKNRSQATHPDASELPFVAIQLTRPRAAFFPRLWHAWKRHRSRLFSVAIRKLVDRFRYS